MFARQLAGELFEVGEKVLLAFFRLRASAVEERLGKNDLEKALLVDRITRARDHAERGDDVADDGIVRQRASVRETTRNSRCKERRLGAVTDLVASIEQRVLTPVQTVVLAVATEVVDDPRDLGVLGGERESGHREYAIALRLRVSPIPEDRRVDHD